MSVAASLRSITDAADAIVRVTVVFARERVPPVSMNC
jgi:hypothetical protein